MNRETNWTDERYEAEIFKEYGLTECIIDESHTYEQFDNNEPHSSDCAYWVNEPCNCIMGKLDLE